MDEHAYLGGELALFRRASNWKAYWATSIAPYLRGDVLEVGAGLGGNVQPLLAAGTHLTSLTLLEPDAGLARQACGAASSATVPVEVRQGYLSDLVADRQFDTILYIDVLEHIAADAEEFRRAAGRLRPGGRLIVLVPAFPYLFSAFDRQVGHYRRYDRGVLSQLTAPSLVLQHCYYLDSAGWLASVANRLLLRQSLPTVRQVAFWDRWLVPLSRWMDRLCGRWVGKSLIGIWIRTAN